MCKGNASWHHDTPTWRQVATLGRLLNGSWFSTQAAGECRQGESVGVDCWWRIVAQERNVNASCVSERVLDEVLRHGASCFDDCGDAARNRSSACFVRCLFSTLTTQMDRAQILSPFEKAFESAEPAEGGCPEVPACRPPCKPPTTTTTTSEQLGTGRAMPGAAWRVDRPVRV